MAEENATKNERAIIEMFETLQAELQGFSKIHTDMYILRCELKAEMVIFKEKVKDIESSLEFTQVEIDLLKEDNKANEDQIAKLQHCAEDSDRKINELTKKFSKTLGLLTESSQ